MRTLTRFIAFALCAASALAMGQGIAPSLTTSSGVQRSEWVATTDAQYFVDPTGSDANACTSSGTFACLTCSGVLSKIPKRIVGASVVVTFAAGTFAGCQVSGFNIEASSTGAAGQLILAGNLPTSTTLATGSATGTLTAFSATSGTTFAVATDSTQTWTSNNLVGHLVKFAGTGSTAKTTFVITANTGTTFTVAGSATGFTTSTTYTILDFGGTVIGTGVPAESSAVTGVANYALAGMRIVDNVAGGTSGAIVLQGFTFLFGSTTTAINLDGDSRTLIRWNKFTTNTSTGVSITRAAAAQVDRNYFSSITTGIIAAGSSSASAGVGAEGNYFSAGTSGVLVGGQVIILSNNLFSGQTSASISVGTGSLGSSQIVQNRITGSAFGISMVASQSNGGVLAALGININDISNCTTAAIDLESPKASVFTNSLSGTGNTIAVKLTWGAHFQLSANSTITGTTEASVDGNTASFATIRALTPIVYPAVASPYGTAIFQ